ncbi:MAG: LamG domain-containing protein [Verrucomicrobia bacterium]|nr:LamG domain-containing protein [Verrucomicrobiota bacterium]
MKTRFAFSPSPVLFALCVLMIRASALADTTNCLTPPAGLVGWWTGDGNANDLSTYNHGTTNGGVTFVPGKVNLAFHFDGTTGYVLVPDSPNLDLRSGATLGGWIKLSELPSEAGHFMHVVGKSQSGNDLYLQVETDNRVWFYVGPGVAVDSTSVLQTGVWYLVTATYHAANRLELYVNGVLEGTITFPFVRSVNPNPLSIGWNTIFGGRFFSGSIDEVEVYERALSETEIQAIYNAGSAGKCRPPTSPVSIYRAVVIGWATETNRQYQLQWTSQFITNGWMNFGAPISGTGSNVYFFDSTRGREKCFYRVLNLSQ